MVSASASLKKVSPQSFYALIVDIFSSNVAASILTSVHNHEGCYIHILHSMIASDPRWNSRIFSRWHKGLIHCSGSVVVHNLQEHYQRTVAVNPTIDYHTPSKICKDFYDNRIFRMCHNFICLFVCFDSLHPITLLQSCIGLSLIGHLAIVI